MAVRPVFVAAAVAALWAAPAAAAPGDDCDPAVERALVETAEAGARDDVRIVRHPRLGVRDPDSLFDLSCVTDMFDYRHSNILFSPDRAMADILGLLRGFVCDRAREAYRGFVGRSLDATVFAHELPPVPGLDVGVEWGNLLDDLDDAAGRPGAPGGPVVDPSSLPAPGVYPAPPGGERESRSPAGSRPELLRSLLGGDEEAEERQ